MKLCDLRWPLLVAVALLGCSRKIPEPAPEVRRDPPREKAPEVKELVKEDVKVGTGPEAKSGDTVKVQYTGRLMSGTKFDSSVGRDPFEFTIGTGSVIKGWDQGVVGMRVGGKRKLTIPSRLAYGKKGSPPKIPANAALKFDIELLEIVGTDDAGGEADD